LVQPACFYSQQKSIEVHKFSANLSWMLEQLLYCTVQKLIKNDIVPSSQASYMAQRDHGQL